MGLKLLGAMVSCSTEYLRAAASRCNKCLGQKQNSGNKAKTFKIHYYLRIFFCVFLNERAQPWPASLMPESSATFIREGRRIGNDVATALDISCLSSRRSSRHRSLPTAKPCWATNLIFPRFGHQPLQSLFPGKFTESRSCPPSSDPTTTRTDSGPPATTNSALPLSLHPSPLSLSTTVPHLLHGLVERSR